jgi:hypothetical protein
MTSDNLFLVMRMPVPPKLADFDRRIAEGVVLAARDEWLLRYKKTGQEPKWTNHRFKAPVEYLARISKLNPSKISGNQLRASLARLRGTILIEDALLSPSKRHLRLKPRLALYTEHRTPDAPATVVADGVVTIAWPMPPYDKGVSRNTRRKK